LRSGLSAEAGFRTKPRLELASRLRRWLSVAFSSRRPLATVSCRELPAAFRPILSIVRFAKRRSFCEWPLCPAKLLFPAETACFKATLFLERARFATTLCTRLPFLAFARFEGARLAIGGPAFPIATTLWCESALAFFSTRLPFFAFARLEGARLAIGGPAFPIATTLWCESALARFCARFPLSAFARARGGRLTTPTRPIGRPIFAIASARRSKAAFTLVAARFPLSTTRVFRASAFRALIATAFFAATARSESGFAFLLTRLPFPASTILSRAFAAIAALRCESAATSLAPWWTAFVARSFPWAASS
jgi:hypothetical protein